MTRRARWASGPWSSGFAVDELITTAGIVIEPVTAAQARIAPDAYRDFGEGSGHAAGLAKAMGEPLLFKGDDSTHTDATAA